MISNTKQGTPTERAATKHSRTVGCVGGLGPESTIDYYRSIIARYRSLKKEDSYPPIFITSLDVRKGIALLDAGKLDELADYLVRGVDSVTHAGADFGFIAANTPHIVFNEVQHRSTIPLVSIVNATAQRAMSMGLSKVGLFGTGFTMRANFYPDEFAKANIVVVRPKPDELEYIHNKYIDELLNNKFLPETRDRIERIACRLRDEDGAQAIVLAGTELPLLLRETNGKIGIPFLDTTVIHVEAIVDELVK